MTAPRITKPLMMNCTSISKPISTAIVLNSWIISTPAIVPRQAAAPADEGGPADDRRRDRIQLETGADEAIHIADITGQHNA